jgi:hypothetical protein
MMNREGLFGKRTRYSSLLVVAAALAMSGCKDDGPSLDSRFATSTTSTAGNTAAAPATSSTSPAPATAAPATAAPGTTPTATSAAGNRAPTLSGAATAAVNVGQTYTFTPTANDADGDRLGFSIQNKPTWATFDTTTARLSGTPGAADAGLHSNIRITVSDGKTSVALPAFAINVTQISTGNATLTWSPPTENMDGTALTNLSGYQIYYGTSPSALTQTITVGNAGVTTYVVENLSPATWYFAIKAVTSQGGESDMSAVATKTIS